jgi:phosphoribosyl 1,2-cyclic phosphate phosphodiesterase
LGHAVPLYCETVVEARLRESYSYVFADVEHTHRGAVPALEFHTIGVEPFEVLGATVTPIRLKHGPRFNVLGFRVGDVAYCTDTNEIPVDSMQLLQGLDCLILDALRPRPHQTHFSLDESIAVAQKINARQTYFTHCSCELDYDKTNAALPAHMQLAYDGLRIPLAHSPPGEEGQR